MCLRLAKCARLCKKIQVLGLDARRNCEDTMKSPINETAQQQLFTKARSHNGWHNQTISAARLHALYDLVKMWATSANCEPARFVFVTSQAAKARLMPHLLEANQAKTQAAPACIIVAYDTQFYEFIPQLFPHNPGARDWFVGSTEFATRTALLNGSLQGGYLIMAARTLGLDVGPMSGFDNAGVDAEFPPDGRCKSNFLCNIGYGSDEDLFERSPRLSFDEACQIV